MTPRQQVNAGLLGAICEDYWKVHLYYSPIEGLGHGLAEAKTCFYRESLDDVLQRNLSRRALAKRLIAVDPSALEGQDRISYQMLERQLQLDAKLESLDDDIRPNYFPFGPEAGLQMVAASFSASDAESASQYLDRLATVPRSFRDLITRYEAGVDQGYRHPSVLKARVLSNAEAAFTGVPAESPLLRPLDGPRFQKERAKAVALLEREVYPALAQYRDGLDRLLGTASRDSIGLLDEPKGGEYYSALVDRHTSLQLAPEEIHRLGLDELERIQSELVAVAQQAGHGGNVAELRKFVDANPKFTLGSDVELRERIEILSKRIDSLIPSFFAKVPRSTYGVRSIPREMAQNMPPAYAQPAPADRSAPGIHWITSIPERCPTYMHVPLALHEAWPGHLMHLALMEEIEGLPSFRKFGAMQHNAYIEGWALYCEGLGAEMNLYDSPYAHFGRLSMDAWRAARLVVDTGIHTMGWSRDEAVSFLEERQAMGRHAAEAEIDRYIGMPAQALSYKLGHIAIRALRAEAEVQLGERFSIREFHSQLIDGGALSLAILNSQVRQWIRSRAAA